MCCVLHFLKSNLERLATRNCVGRLSCNVLQGSLKFYVKTFQSSQSLIFVLVVALLVRSFDYQPEGDLLSAHERGTGT